MVKYFIDAGAHDGCSVRRFREEHDPNCEYFIYSFEADPYFEYKFDNIENHVFLGYAVWIDEGSQDFYRSHAWLQDGGTLVKEKKSGKLDKDSPISVKTVDFSKWVENILSPEDYIILKMDIEGAEYKVLPKMIEDGTIDFINELWIEWHWKKIGLSKAKHNELVNKISIPIKEWCALQWCGLRKRERNG